MPSLALSANCRFTSDDKTAVRETGAALQVAGPIVTRVMTAANPSASQVRRAATAAARYAVTARIGRARADNPTIQRILGLYASGWVKLAIGFNAAASGNGALASSQVTAWDREYRRGQDVFRTLIKHCNLRAGAFG